MQTNIDIQVPPGWLEPTLHPSYLKLMLRFRGYSIAQISKHFDSRTGLYSYLEIHNILQHFEVGSTAQTAVDFGLNTSLAAHGLFGQAAVASANLDQAMTVIATYKPTRNNVFTYDWRVSDKYGVFTMTPRFDLREHQETSTTTSLVNLVQIAAFLCGDELVPEMELSVPWENIAQALSFQNAKSIRVRKVLTKGKVSLRIPVEFLHSENIFADARQYHLASRGCEEELNILRGRFTERVRSLITHTDYTQVSEGNIRWLSLGEVAESLAVSPRSLNRKLKNENTSYSQILDQTRSDMACWYLRHSEVSVSTISRLLGFSDDTNFGRTFKRWKNTAPTSYRAQRF